MSDSDLGFSVDRGTEDRAALLAEAAALADAGHLGGTTRGGQESAGIEPEAAPVASPAGTLIRELGRDRIDLAFPEVYRITDHDFLDKGRPAPVRLTELTRDFSFYWMRFPVSLFPAPSWRFDRLQVGVSLSVEGGPELQPSAYQILPNKAFQALISATTRLEVGIDENFQLTAHAAAGGDAGVAGAEASAAVDVTGATGAKLVAGPFLYNIRNATIDHSDPGQPRVFWRIDGDAHFEEGVPAFVVIAQVPKRAGKAVRVEVAAQGSRFFSYARASLKDVIGGLPGRIKAFFQGGAPITATATYDLSSRL